MTDKIIDVFNNLLNNYNLRVNFYYLQKGKKKHVMFIVNNDGEEQMYPLDDSNEEFIKRMVTIAREDVGVSFNKSNIKSLILQMESIAVEGENPYKKIG
jgi:hypothetical protein